MGARGRARELGCHLPLTLIGEVNGVSREQMNKDYVKRPERFDTRVINARDGWASICTDGRGGHHDTEGDAKAGGRGKNTS